MITRLLAPETFVFDRGSLKFFECDTYFKDLIEVSCTNSAYSLFYIATKVSDVTGWKFSTKNKNSKTSDKKRKGIWHHRKEVRHHIK